MLDNTTWVRGAPCISLRHRELKVCTRTERAGEENWKRNNHPGGRGSLVVCWSYFVNGPVMVVAPARVVSVRPEASLRRGLLVRRRLLSATRVLGTWLDYS
jgi:hypothetical protein